MSRTLVALAAAAPALAAAGCGGNGEAAVRALRRGRIDGLVLDLPSALSLEPGAKVVGRLPRPSGGGYPGMVLAKGSGLTGCVDSALTALQQNRTLARLQKRWLETAEGAPILH